jgi:hypothetical protein
VLICACALLCGALTFLDVRRPMRRAFSKPSTHLWRLFIPPHQAVRLLDGDRAHDRFGFL